jgi:UDP-N-acetylmuramoylalanine--D-glutamate ligase
MNYVDHFAGKKITVMRIGLLGRGVGDAAFLAEAGAQVLVVDDAPAEVMQPSVDALKQYSNITFKFGPYDTADFISADYVLVGAGTPINSPELAAAKLAGVPLKQSAAWFAELSGIPIIGVTGTRGKSTVTHMIHHVLSQVTGEPVLLGGNIRGRSNLQLLNEVKPDSLCVMELDSWQLQGWGWSEMSPQIAVFTNFMEDHLNYYQGPGMSKPAAMDVYFADKANIFSYQEESGVLITTPEVFEQAKQMPGATLGQEVILADSSGIPADGLLAMPGEHNRLNAALAIEALKALSLTEEEIYPALASFSGVEGRLQYLGAPDGIGIFNDNNATEPNATIAGLKALDLGSKNIILIAGGADKMVDLAPFALAINQHCKQVFLTPGSGTDKLVELLHGEDISVSLLDGLESSVSAAYSAAAPGDIILFSPAFASFAQYKNEYERNDAFLAATDPIINPPS